MTNEGKALLVDAGEPHWPMAQRSGAGTNWRHSRASTVFALCTTSAKGRLTPRDVTPESTWRPQTGQITRFYVRKAHIRA